MSGLFEHIAFVDEEGRLASRKATILANQRVDERLSSFVQAGKDKSERVARLSLVENDLNGLVTIACDEVGATNHDSIIEAIKDRLVGVDEPVERTSSVHESRKPKLCPYHREVMDISLAQGEPRAGFDAMAQHAWSAQHCQGTEYGGDKCNFKRDMVTQEYWDQKNEKAEERRRERAESPEVVPSFEPPVPVEDPEPRAEPTENDDPIEQPEQPEEAAEQEEVPMAMAASSLPLDGDQKASAQKKHLEGDLVTDKRQRQYEHIKESCLEDGKSEEECKELAARTVNKQRAEKGETKSHTADTLKTIDIEQESGPVPKMDKRRWTPDNVNFVDVEMEGSVNPTVHQDIIEPASYDRTNDPLEGAKAGLERQDVTKKSPAQKGSALADPDKNPIRQVLEDEHGFLPQIAVKEAVARTRK